MDLYRRVSKLCSIKQIPLADLAAALNCDEEQLISLLNSNSCTPYGELKVIAKTLKVSVKELIFN